MQENELGKIRTIVSEVSSYVVNPVYLRQYEEDIVVYPTREKRLILSIFFLVSATKIRKSRLCKETGIGKCLMAFEN